MTLIDAIEGMVLAACFLRYANAPDLGDTFVSATSSASWNVINWHVSPVDQERLWRIRDGDPGA